MDEERKPLLNLLERKSETRKSHRLGKRRRRIMQTLSMYDSKFDNTERIARAVVERLGQRPGLCRPGGSGINCDAFVMLKCPNVTVP